MAAARKHAADAGMTDRVRFERWDASKGAALAVDRWTLWTRLER